MLKKPLKANFDLYCVGDAVACFLSVRTHGLIISLQTDDGGLSHQKIQTGLYSNVGIRAAVTTDTGQDVYQQCEITVVSGFTKY